LEITHEDFKLRQLEDKLGSNCAEQNKH